MLKHNENLEKKEKVKYDLYKILRMSVLLSQNEVDDITLNKFREASFNIDKMLSEEYDKKLDTMFYNTETLEEEAKRLKELVAFVSDRLEKRKSLLEDYRSVTSSELIGLEYINKSGDLDLYEKRLNTIRNYLDSSKLIEVNESDLEKLKEDLVKEYDLKSTNEIKNVKIEEKLYSVFVNALYEMDLYSSLDFDNIDREIDNLQQEIIESKDQMDTFLTAFNNLKLSGISGDLELEYATYVENSKKNYYYVKERELVLKLYKLINNKQSEYSELYNKREDVKELLQERTFLRTQLNIKDVDHLANVSDLIFEQKNEIDSEKSNVDNINILTERIRLKENRLEELKREVKKPEILSLLKEFSLIDTYEHDDVVDTEFDEENDELEKEVILDETDEVSLLKDLIDEDEIIETPEETEKVVKEYKENQIKESLDVPTMNFGLSRLKSISVMKRVADMLGVNAKKEEVKPEVKEEVKTEVVSEVKSIEPEKIEEQEETNVDNNDLFWSPVEFVDMKKETEEEEPKVVTTEPELTVPELNMPELTIEQDIFASNNDNGLIFPEPVMPELGQKVLPENNSDKFMWPDNMETFDINGIFPN